MKDQSENDGEQKAVKVTASVLDAFDLLKATKHEDKLNGGARIVSQVQGNENERDINYALKRLVRSLGANIPEIRTGYFATLVTLLTKCSQVTVSQLMELSKKELHASNSSKSEVGDVALGNILVCSAILRSGLMLRSTPEEQVQVIQLLMTASQKKSYLTTVAYLVLLDFVKGLNDDQFASIVWTNIKHDFKKEIKDHNLDSLYFLLVASTKFPGKVKLRKLIGVSEILCEDNIHAICEKLMAGIDFNSISHPIYKEVGTQIANSPHLKLFWVSGIDSQLLKHNRNRELVSINILTTVLNNLKENVEVIPELLSQNFFKLFMDWFKGLQTASKIRNKRDNEDDRKIMIKKEKELLTALGKALKLESITNDIRVEVLRKLLFNPGEMNFTEISGTTIVKSIVSDLDKSGVKEMAKLLKGVLLNSTKKTVKADKERNWYNNERAKAAELLSYLVCHEAVKDSIEFRLTYMKLMMCCAFFKPGGTEEVNINKDLAVSIKSSFYRCFTSRYSNVDNLVSVLSSLSTTICEMLTKEELRTKIEKLFPEENMECWQMVTGVCETIEAIENKSKVDKVFLVLLYQLGLFLFSEPAHVKMAKSSIKELKCCYEHYRKTKKKTKKSNNNSLTEEPKWIEVLVEVLLSILSTESSVLRSVVQCVFRLLWEYLTPSAFGQIVSVIDPESESNPLTDVDSDEEDSDNEENDDNENEDEEEREQNEEGSNDENESDSNIEDEDDDDELKTPDQLRMAVHKALGATAESDAESVDADMITEEEAKKLDDALADAFKQFHQGKGKKTKKERKDKKALSDFRIRVLDLIDIYLEKDPSMDICLGMIAPLTRCLEFCIVDTQFRELENRVRKTIKILTKVKKFTSTDDVTVELLEDYLKSIIDKGARSHFMFQAIGDVITYYSMFIIHCSQKIQVNKKNSTIPLIAILKDALQNYFQNRNCLLPIIFFHNILQSEWEGIYELAPVIIDNVFNKDVRQFRRNEGIDLLAGFYRALKRIKPSSEKSIAKISKLEQTFKKKLTETFEIENGFEVKNNFFNVLNKLFKTMKNFHESCNIESSIDIDSLPEIVKSGKSKLVIKSNKQTPNEIQNVEMVNGNKKKKKKQKKRRISQTNGHEPQEKRPKIQSSE